MKKVSGNKRKWKQNKTATKGLLHKVTVCEDAVKRLFQTVLNVETLQVRFCALTARSQDPFLNLNTIINLEVKVFFSGGGGGFSVI